VHVAPEVLAVRRVVVAGRGVAPIGAHLLDLGRREAQVLIGLEREEAREHLLHGEAREVLHLPALALGRLPDDLGQGEHAEAHVP
jgi:hypothetical protein